MTEKEILTQIALGAFKVDASTYVEIKEVINNSVDNNFLNTINAYLIMNASRPFEHHTYMQVLEVHIHIRRQILLNLLRFPRND